ncbi:hypothetical protein J7E78_15805 [Paenibacillus polymyxa]|uniref:DUF7309 domain-containing protein n=1 Tax=Paenibacillus polymyxa TaxID=1406 RepID=UPI001BEA4BEB|nr:hypothetical protein [Paenibacillus polymyxa]MBT2285005.1 hypothetical protein [Paenibacillus polymyxa]
MKLLIEEARPLYEAANRFKQQASWQWLSSSHIFGVQDPESGQIGYCTVMGNGGEMYGMAVYLGTEGLNALFDLMQGNNVEDPVFTQKCLLLSFENRDELSSEEYKQLKALGFSYRGRNAWPTFHRYEPGFVPGPVREAKELRFFATCVEQAIEVASAVQSDPDQLFPSDQRLFLTRVPELSSDGQTFTWSSQWVEPQPIVVEETASIFIDEFQQARLRKLPCPPESFWEFGLSYLPTSIGDKERPYFPQIIIVTEPASGMIIHSAVAEQKRSMQQCAEELVDLLLQRGYRPSQLILSRPELAQALLPLLASIDIEVYTAERLPMVEDVLQEMNQFLH